MNALQRTHNNLYGPPFEPRRMEIQSYPLSTDPASW